MKLLLIGGLWVAASCALMWANYRFWNWLEPKGG